MCWDGKISNESKTIVRMKFYKKSEKRLATPEDFERLEESKKIYFDFFYSPDSKREGILSVELLDSDFSVKVLK